MMPATPERSDICTTEHREILDAIERYESYRARRAAVMHNPRTRAAALVRLRHRLPNMLHGFRHCLVQAVALLESLALAAIGRWHAARVGLEEVVVQDLIRISSPRAGSRAASQFGRTTRREHEVAGVP